MSKWEDFENECTKYLNEKYDKHAKFSHLGCSNSRLTDILVQTKSNKNFYIDTKLSPAQCSQFVLIPNIEKGIFEYSCKNVNQYNIFADEIIKFMNNNFNYFKDAGTNGKEIKFENSETIFSNWIIETYKNKGVKFFITNNYIILPIEEISNYFYISAKYRTKRSGSSKINKCNIEAMEQFVLSNYPITNIEIIENSLFVTSNINIENNRFTIGKYEYIFAKRNNKYELRKLSNTFNANVIFSIKLKKAKGLSDNEFIQYLK